MAGRSDGRYKTSLCRSFLTDGTCPYGNRCMYAHGEHELRAHTAQPQPPVGGQAPARPICRHFAAGTCGFGDRCKYAHPGGQAGPSAPPPPPAVHAQPNHPPPPPPPAEAAASRQLQPTSTTPAAIAAAAAAGPSGSPSPPAAPKAVMPSKQMVMQATRAMRQGQHNVLKALLKSAQMGLVAPLSKQELNQLVHCAAVEVAQVEYLDSILESIWQPPLHGDWTLLSWEYKPGSTYVANGLLHGVCVNNAERAIIKVVDRILRQRPAAVLDLNCVVDPANQKIYITPLEERLVWYLHSMPSSELLARLAPLTSSNSQQAWLAQERAIELCEAMTQLAYERKVPELLPQSMEYWVACASILEEGRQKRIRNGDAVSKGVEFLPGASGVMLAFARHPVPFVPQASVAPATTNATSTPKAGASSMRQVERQIAASSTASEAAAASAAPPARSPLQARARSAAPAVAAASSNPFSLLQATAQAAPAPAPAPVPAPALARAALPAAISATSTGLAALPSSFMPSPRFCGALPGYAFKLGEQGMGYYRDPQQQQPARHQQQQEPRTQAAAPAAAAATPVLPARMIAVGPNFMASKELLEAAAVKVDHDVIDVDGTSMPISITPMAFGDTGTVAVRSALPVSQVPPAAPAAVASFSAAAQQPVAPRNDPQQRALRAVLQVARQAPQPNHREEGQHAPAAAAAAEAAAPAAAYAATAGKAKEGLNIFKGIFPSTAPRAAPASSASSSTTSVPSAASSSAAPAANLGSGPLQPANVLRELLVALKNACKANDLPLLQKLLQQLSTPCIADTFRPPADAGSITACAHTARRSQSSNPKRLPQEAIRAQVHSSRAAAMREALGRFCDVLAALSECGWVAATKHHSTDMLAALDAVQLPNGETYRWAAMQQPEPGVLDGKRVPVLQQLLLQGGVDGRECAWPVVQALVNADRRLVKDATEPLLAVALRVGAPADTVRLLLGVAAENLGLVDRQDSQRTNALGWAFIKNRSDVLPRLLAKADAAAPAVDGLPLMHWAAEKGKVEVVQALLQHNPELMVQAAKGVTPLYRAVVAGQLEVARLLLQSGASPLDPVLLPGSEGFRDTCVHEAALREDLPMLSLLLGLPAAEEEGAAQPPAATGKGSSASDAKRSAADGAAAAAEAGPSPSGPLPWHDPGGVDSAQDGHRLSPLMVALAERKLASARLLLRAGCDPTTTYEILAGGTVSKGALQRAKDMAKAAKQAAEEGDARARSGSAQLEHELLAQCFELKKNMKAPQGYSALSYAVAHEQDFKQALLPDILAQWQPDFTASVLKAALGAQAGAQLRAWLLRQAQTTLDPTIEALWRVAAAKGVKPGGSSATTSASSSSSPALVELPWLCPPLLDLLMERMEAKHGPSWHTLQPRLLPHVSVWSMLTAEPSAPVAVLQQCASPALLRRLLAHGLADCNESGRLDKPDRGGSTLLHKACWAGSVELMRVLLEAGADANAPDALGSTPLHVALLCRTRLGPEHKELRDDVALAAVALLLEHGADIRARDRAGDNALHMLAMRGYHDDIMLKVMRLLLGTGEGKDAAVAAGKGQRAAAGADGGGAEGGQGPRALSYAEKLDATRTRNGQGKQPEELVASKKAKKLLQDEIAVMQRQKAFQEKAELSARIAKASGGGAKGAGAADGAGAAGSNKAKAKAAKAAGEAEQALRVPPHELSDAALRRLALSELVAAVDVQPLLLAGRLAQVLPSSSLRAAAAGGAAAAGDAPAADSDAANAATNRELQRIVQEMRVDDEQQGDGGGEDDDTNPDWQAEGGGAGGAYSEDDAPPPGEEVVEAELLAAQQQLDVTQLLKDLPWRFVITRQAYESWGKLPDKWRQQVMARLHAIGSGYWARCRGAKKLTADDPALAQQELWRLKLTKGGRILFEVAVEYDEDSRTWAEMIRLWFITLNHKHYEDMIGLVRASFRRTLAMRERLRLQPLPHHEAPAAAVAAPHPSPGKAAAAAAAGVVAGGSRATQRLPRHYKEAAAEEGAKAKQDGGGAAAAANGGRQAAAGGTTLREHFPPASWAADTYTLMKFYNLDSYLLSAVLHGLSEAQVEFPFKLSPQEYDLITLTPHPPSSIILLGRSGTGKTTCAVYRLWGNWLRHHTNPNLDPCHSAFVTASATLREQVARAFRRLQSAVLSAEQWAEVSAAANATYHTFRDVPSTAFPLFLSSRTYLRMLDGTTQRPFFPRTHNGAILQRPDDHEEVDPDGAALVVALDEDASDDEEEREQQAAAAAAAGDAGRLEEGGDEGAEGAAFALQEEVEAAAAVARAEAARGAALQALDVGSAEAAWEEGGGIAGRARLNREVTYQYFTHNMWKRITTPEQRDKLAPGLVYQEIVSYLKGSSEAIASPSGHLSREAYVALGRSRAPNFSDELRDKLVWPVFEKYERLKRSEWRYDLLDVVGNVYRQVEGAGGQTYDGTPVHVLYRDEVQDFTQGELLLDLAVVADPNGLFYCGDTAQTIARGIGFRFTDIRTLFWEENERRKAASRTRGGAACTEIATPPIHQLTMNYRTHQGVLDVAALVVDVLKRYFPRQLDRLERERALFPGPHPLLLGGISVDDLAILLSGADRNMSQVEFGAHQVILVRSMASVDQLPDEIRLSNAIIMTVPQAKGLEFDDVFIVDFFADSEAGAEWRVLSAFLQDLQPGAGQEGGAAADATLQAQYTVQQVTAPDPGAVRPLAFDERAHVLLSEELKHLYTALTRAKNNVVIFDRNPAKRAPFYHLLQSLGLARTVHKSLLEDGHDAVRYGLTQQATSSRAEWAKRARNLLDNRNYAMAKKAFSQAQDKVRAEVADAYAKRHKAAEEDLPPNEQRKLLAQAALQLLAAVSRAHEAPDPVTPLELHRWVSLAARCLQACGAAREAAQLYYKKGRHEQALRMLLDANEPQLAAECCVDAASEALKQAQEPLQQQQQQGGAAAALAVLAQGRAAAGQQPLQQQQQYAAVLSRTVVPWLAKAAEQFFAASSLDALSLLLAPQPQAAGHEAAGAAAAAATAGGAAAPAIPPDAWLSDDEEEEGPDVEAPGAAAAAAAHAQEAQPAGGASGPGGVQEVADVGAGHGVAARLAPFAFLSPQLNDYLRRRWPGSYGKALQRVAIACNAQGAHRRACAALRLLPAAADREVLLERFGYKRELARAKSATDPLAAAQILLDCARRSDVARAVRLLASHVSRAAAALPPQPPSPLVWELLQRCLAAQPDAHGVALVREQLDVCWAETPEGELGAKAALLRGQALLMEARLRLQPWLVAVNGPAHVHAASKVAAAAGPQGSKPQQAAGSTGPEQVPDSWEGGAAAGAADGHGKEADGAAAKPAAAAAGEKGAAGRDSATAAWEAACPLLLQALECFAAPQHWLGQLDALHLILLYAPQQLLSPPAQAAAAGSSALALAGPGVLPANLVSRTLQLCVSANNALEALQRSRVRATAAERSVLASLDQHYGLPGLASWDERLSTKQATHNWHALLAPSAEHAASMAADKAPKASYAAAAASRAMVAGPSMPFPLEPTSTFVAYAAHSVATELSWAVQDTAGGTLPRNKVAEALARDVCTKVALMAHLLLSSALAAHYAGREAPPARSGADILDRALATLQPLLQAQMTASRAMQLLEAAKGAFKIQSVALVRSLQALTRRTLLAVVAAPLVAAPCAGFQSRIMTGLRALMKAHELQLQDVRVWLQSFADNLGHAAARGRLALVPGLSYVSWRAWTLLCDGSNRRTLFPATHRFAADVPPAYLVGGEKRSIAEGVLGKAYEAFCIGNPQEGLRGLLYYLAWCARRDGLLTTSTTVERPDAFSGGAGGASAAAAGGATDAAVVPGALPLEAYVEVSELAVGALLLGCCETAFVPSSVEGALTGVLVGQATGQCASLQEVAVQWRNKLDPVATAAARRGAPAGRGKTGKAAGGEAGGQEGQREPKEELGKQLLLGARLLLVLAKYVAGLLRAQQQQQQAASQATGERTPQGGAGAGAGTGAAEPACTTGSGANDAAAVQLAAATPVALLRELLPLAETPVPQSNTKATSKELLQAAAKTRPPKAAGPRLEALACRLLLASSACLLSLELQERVAAGTGGSSGGAAAAAAGGRFVRPAGRSRDSTADDMRLLKEATSLLLAALPAGGVAARFWGQVKGARMEASLAAWAQALRLATLDACGPSGLLLMVDPRSRREFEGFGTKGALASVANAKLALARAQEGGAEAAASLVRDAEQAVQMVASRTYAAADVEEMRQGKAAATIQHAWRDWCAWRRARQQKEAEDKRRAEVVERLRTNFTFRLAVRLMLVQYRRRAVQRKEEQKRAVAELAAATQERLHDDPFGFEEVHAKLQALSKALFIDESRCPVCPHAHVAQQEQHSLLQQMARLRLAVQRYGEQALQQRNAARLEQAAAVIQRAWRQWCLLHGRMSHTPQHPAGEAGGAAGSSQEAADGAAVAPSLPNLPPLPSSALLRAAAGREFTPHMHKQQHQEAAASFQKCYAWYKAQVAPLLEQGMLLCEQMKKMCADMSEAAAGIPAETIDQSLHTIEETLCTIDIIHKQLQQLAEARAWDKGGSSPPAAGVASEAPDHQRASSGQLTAKLVDLFDCLARFIDGLGMWETYCKQLQRPVLYPGTQLQQQLDIITKARHAIQASIAPAASPTHAAAAPSVAAPNSPVQQQQVQQHHQHHQYQQQVQQHHQHHQHHQQQVQQHHQYQQQVQLASPKQPTGMPQQHPIGAPAPLMPTLAGPVMRPFAAMFSPQKQAPAAMGAHSAWSMLQMPPLPANAAQLMMQHPQQAPPMMPHYAYPAQLSPPMVTIFAQQEPPGLQQGPPELQQGPEDFGGAGSGLQISDLFPPGLQQGMPGSPGANGHGIGGYVEEDDEEFQVYQGRRKPGQRTRYLNGPGQAGGAGIIGGGGGARRAVHFGGGPGPAPAAGGRGGPAPLQNRFEALHAAGGMGAGRRGGGRRR